MEMCHQVGFKRIKIATSFKSGLGRINDGRFGIVLAEGDWGVTIKNCLSQKYHELLTKWLHPTGFKKSHQGAAWILIDGEVMPD